MGTTRKVLIIRVIVFWGRYWAPHMVGNYNMEACKRLESLFGAGSYEL